MAARIAWLVTMSLAGCAPNVPPIDLAGIHVILLCGVNCPLAVTLADEGRVTDAVPLEYEDVSADAVRAGQGDT